LGCYINTTKVSTGSVFVIVFVIDFALIFLLFGIGLDPRQRSIFGLALGPIFISIVLGIYTFVTGFSRIRFKAGNPARCFGAMVGSHFASYHWIHWIAPLSASIIHGMLYHFILPYSRKRTSDVSRGNVLNHEI
ncbi:hypothetical protein N7449_007989, partial [Penicillium cf. viridicatum]